MSREAIYLYKKKTRKEGKPGEKNSEYRNGKPQQSLVTCYCSSRNFLPLYSILLCQQMKSNPKNFASHKIQSKPSSITELQKQKSLIISNQSESGNIIDFSSPMECFLPYFRPTSSLIANRVVFLLFSSFLPRKLSHRTATNFTFTLFKNLRYFRST